MKKKPIITRVLTVIALGLLLSATIVVSNNGVGATSTPDMSNGADNFYMSNQVNMKKVEFKNQYNMKVVGNLFTPKSFLLVD